MSETAAEQAATWGRVDSDGTVYVRTPEGERPVGSWQAGSPDEGLAFYARRYDDLAAEVGLLETRLVTGKANAVQTREAAAKLWWSLSEANVVGDIEALQTRLVALDRACEQRMAKEKEVKAARTAERVAKKTALVEEAEQLADSTQWKRTGERFREIAGTWREIHIDRATDAELWKRFRKARDQFTSRRSAHFAAATEQREEAKARKEKLVAEAEGLASSREFKTTAARLKALMREWKAAGHADRPVEDALWTRFRAAQDQFFTRLTEVNAERDAKTKASQDAREALVKEAESIDVSDLAAAQTKLRNVQDRLDKAGPVPRDVEAALDARLAAVVRRIREASDARHREARVENSPLVIRLRESVTKLEKRIERARAAGNDRELAESEAALATQREWLAQAERGG
ncbi:MAG: DUF349 domain-containing protein [Actinomycetes bacterium]